jgi:predicted hydrocarbon binding protein
MLDTSSFRERLAWSDAGGIHDGDIRYLLLRADSLMGLFKRLDPGVRMQAFNAFAESLAENGRKSIEARMLRQNLSPAELYDDLARSSGSHLGWGAWTYRRISLQRFEVDVANSPFAQGYGPAEHPVCFPIVGMLTAIGQLVLGTPVQVAETTCAAVSRNLCHFVVSTEQT